MDATPEGPKRGPLTPEEVAAVEQRWLDTVYRGDKMPEFTVQVFFVAVLLSFLMVAFNIYMGLKTGWGEGGSVIAVAALVKASRHDIGSPEGLRSEVNDYVRRNLASYKIVSVNVEPYRDAQRNTDCARINTVSEESGNPLHPGKVLLMTVAGKACRHPLSVSHYVQVTYSERRPVGLPPLIDDALREECETTVNSLEFLPIRRP